MTDVEVLVARKLGGQVETCPGCGRSFVRVKDYLVDWRHGYSVVVPAAELGAWTVAIGYPTHGNCEVAG